ncbi:hypothetical protein IAI10_23580 [Clostridium sp. 19966]|uniref:hypothetical protein n=1 Tax=Clostridium sp. 19966 TaxID=2768166 RepID=UPI0028E02BF5|nr:hypothetical protein [Clostridium sp. 19966]MDT8719627.1 hypothetical protein [Clostridium sp. 19966]
MPIKTENIKKIELHGLSGGYKIVKDENDIKKIEALINTVKIKGICKEDYFGMGCGVRITYSDGKVLNFAFLSSTVNYANNGSLSCYYIDKDIVDELKSYYDKL